MEARTFDPFREMDRILGTVNRGPSSPVLPMDLYRDGDRFVVAVDLPGVDPSSIDIDVEERTLTIRAERRSSVSEDAQWLTHERPVGTFARQLTLGYGVSTERIEADYSDGVLTLTIPVAEEAKPRKIQVSHAGKEQAITPGAAPDVVESTTEKDQG
ncbi:Hsp20 family protein [Arsenicicoccus sp. MKL-02]|uniref:Hsp20 family protein n=1 Tax=Arsenicicoccus cauae TaxID=2663847 RepID=A0A6I3IE97_9MICO|nr:Hsp20/alpha crystallin family protein [Arsenicicoccus cauae]MTB70983.1 Hsp20 family protein [Arsenicicoccus cauae]